MTKTLFAFLILFGALAHAETACTNDGCVAKRNNQLDAVLAYMHNNDDCLNAVSYLQSLKRTGDNTFEVICGDSSDRSTFLYKTAENRDGSFSVTIQQL